MDHEIEKGLPDGVVLSWGLTKQSKRGPKRELDVKGIVDVAIDIADKDGITAVSMGRVAKSLGFTAMSLYRYIPSKDDLLLLMQDAVCNVSLSEKYTGRDWREALREFVRKSTQIYLDHPWFADIGYESVPMTLNHLKLADWVLQALRDLPLNDHEKMSCLMLLSGYVRSSGNLKRDLDQAKKSKGREAVSGQAYTQALEQLITAERFPYLQTVVASGVYTDETMEIENIDEIDFGLERILDGIQLYIDKKTNK